MQTPIVSHNTSFAALMELLDYILYCIQGIITDKDAGKCKYYQKHKTNNRKNVFKKNYVSKGKNDNCLLPRSSTVQNIFLLIICWFYF